MRFETKRSLLLPVLLVFGSGLFLTAPAAEAPDPLPLQAQLIWGTNEEKSADQKFKEVEPKLRKSLQGVFAWKHYYEISRHSFAVKVNKVEKPRVSSKCEIEVKNFGNWNVHVKLYGEGKSVLQKRQNLANGEPLVLGGDDKDGTAWFVVLTGPRPAAKPAAPKADPKAPAPTAPKTTPQDASKPAPKPPAKPAP